MHHEQGAPESDSDEEIVTVYSTIDEVELITAKLLLDGEGIAYAVIGEAVQHLFGVGRGTGGTGPVELRVRQEDAERAKAVLATMEEGAEG